MNYLYVRKPISLMVMAIMILSISGCKKDNPASKRPSACLSVTNNNPAPGASVIFKNCSKNADHIVVKLGDGTYAGSTPIKHVYADSGVYKAKLTAYSEDEAFKTKSLQTIYVGVSPEDQVGNGSGNGNGDGDDDVSQPFACFNPSDTVIQVGKSVSFSNCSDKSDQYEWIFGDGSTSIKANPDHVYESSGTYEVTLTAFSSNRKKQDDTTITIRAIAPKLSSIELVNFPEQKPNGEDWDNGIIGIISDPDIIMRIAQQNGDVLFENDPISNLSQDQLPQTWEVSEEIKIKNETWIVQLVDNDDNFSDGGGEEIIYENNIVPTDLTQNGTIRLETSSTSINLNYEQ